MSMSQSKVEQSCTWPAPAKLNLFLHITGQRSDGMHELQTVFQFIDLLDWINIKVLNSGAIERPVGMAGVAVEDDLVVRAAKKAKAKEWYKTWRRDRGYQKYSCRRRSWRGEFRCCNYSSCTQSTLGYRNEYRGVGRTWAFARRRCASFY